VTESLTPRSPDGVAPDGRDLEDPAARRLSLVDSQGWQSTATVTVVIHAAEEISRLGVVGQLAHQGGVRVVDAADTAAQVAIAVADRADDYVVRWLRSLHRERGIPVVLVIGELEPRALVSVIESGVCAVLNRADATPERLVQVVRSAARGHAELPPQLLRQLLDQVNRLNRDLLEPRGLSFNGLTRRERQVLELIAAGLSTREVAAQLSYSERTIKNVLQELTIRLQVRNRTQAVACAVRNGWI
jgi:DNA-binding NarL/FixJ family response regulator